MYGENVNPIVVQQYTLLCLFFLFLVSTQRGCMYDPYTIVYEIFNWQEFEESLDKDLFYNVHRMDKQAFYRLLDDILPKLRKKYKRPHQLRLSYACMLSITLSYLGGARICDLRVIYRPIKKR